MKKLLILLTLTLALSCCNKDDAPTNPIDQLPPETQTGANTFGFLVNGEPINITNTLQQTAIYQQGLLQLGAGGIGIDISNPLSINIEYNLVGNTLDGRARYQVDPNPQLGCHYEYENTYQGNIKFTKIDTVNFIISGTFEFSTVTDNCENINITNGRFDLQYIP
ncbi:MAG: hypothetical protein ACK5NB_12800 [Flavobacteriaceae bacterium]